MWGAHWVHSPPSHWPLVTTQKAHAVQKHTHTHLDNAQFCVNRLLKEVCLIHSATVWEEQWLNHVPWRPKHKSCGKSHSLTSFALLGRYFYIRQPHILGLILDDQQTDEGESHTNQSRCWQDCPPVVSLRQHCGNNWAQAASQIHAAGENCPPCPELRRLKPLTADKRK